MFRWGRGDWGLGEPVGEWRGGDFARSESGGEDWSGEVLVGEVLMGGERVRRCTGCEVHCHCLIV